MQREEGDTEQKKQKQNQKRHTKNVQRVVVAVVVVYWLTRLNVFSASLLFCLFCQHTRCQFVVVVCFFVVAWALFSTCERDDVSNETESRHTEIKQLASLGLALDRQLGSAVDADDVGVCVSAGSNAHTHTEKLTQFVCSRSVFSFGILRAWCW